MSEHRDVIGGRDEGQSEGAISICSVCDVTLSDSLESVILCETNVNIKSTDEFLFIPNNTLFCKMNITAAHEVVKLIDDKYIYVRVFNPSNTNVHISKTTNLGNIIRVKNVSFRQMTNKKKFLVV